MVRALLPRTSRSVQRTAEAHGDTTSFRPSGIPARLALTAGPPNLLVGKNATMSKRTVSSRDVRDDEGFLPLFGMAGQRPVGKAPSRGLIDEAHNAARWGQSEYG